MADRAEWAKRVAEWKASGLPSPAFCEGKPFSPGGLRFWAHRLKKSGRRREAAGPALRIGRVVRTASPVASATPASAADTQARPAPAIRGEAPRAPLAAAARPDAAPAAGSLVVEIGSARVTVAAGVDPQALGLVLEVLSRAPGGVR